MKTFIGIAFTFFLLAVQPIRADDNHQAGIFNDETLGDVTFHVSCTPPAQKLFNQAIAMLHSFWYDEAEKTFRYVTTVDKDCAMGHWGVAMSLYRQLWATPPTPEELQKGRDALQRAKQLMTKTDRERAYLEAAGYLYPDDEMIDYGTRKLAYQNAMEQLLAHNPDDSEAAIFYALALISTASPKDKTYSNQKRALNLLQEVLQKEPGHPGVAHYIIHGSDYPKLARFGLKAAREYAQIAPAVPHALHMPSHIFIRLGKWQEAVHSNLAAYHAAKRYAQKNAQTAVWDQQMHFMDYLIYAYLQTGQTEKAEEILREVHAIKKAHPENTTSAYAFAAIPARYAVERGNWHEAARLNIDPADFPWNKFGWCEAITHFARGLGAARIGKIDEARSILHQIEALRDSDKTANKHYTADQIEIQRLAVAGWIAYGEGKTKKAEKLMRASAELEDATEKDNVTPGAIKPARELLGELLLELRKPQEALEEFETSLIQTPNRRNGIYGAAQAARLTGDEQKAHHYERQLQELITTGEIHSIE